MPDPVPFRKRGFAELASSMLKDAASGAGGRPALTDATEGSVVMTLLEAFARELAVAYEQLDVVYRTAYLDTATGGALDNVVALLGLERLPAGYLVGSVEFSRAVATIADIDIPAGTQISGQGLPLMQTAKDATMAAGTRTVQVDVQSTQPVSDGRGIAPNQLRIMTRPIAGIEQVTNPGQMILRQTAETDDELRMRARRAVRGANTATVGALEQAVRSAGVAQVKVLEDPNRPAIVTVIVGDDGVPDEVMARARSAVARVRPAGVRVMVGGATEITIRIAATLPLDKEYAAADQDAIRATLIDAVRNYFATLGVGDTVRAAKLRTVLASDERVVTVEPTVEDSVALPLMSPWAGPQSVAGRTLMANGDIVLDPTERAVLDIVGWPKLTLLSPGVRVDLALTLAADQNVAAIQRTANDALAAFLTRTAADFDRKEQLRASGIDAGALQLDYDALFAALGVPKAAVVIARFTVVHERDGRVAELTASGQKDDFAARERPRLGLVTAVAAPPHA